MDDRRIRTLFLPLRPRRNQYAPIYAARGGRQYAQSFSGAGYSTPKVSTVTFFMTCFCTGLSL